MEPEHKSVTTLENAGQAVLLALVAGALYLAFRIVRPFLDPILIAAILAPIVHPLFRRLRGWLRGRAGAAALLTCLLVVLVILGPLALLGASLVNQGAASIKSIQGWVQQGNLERLTDDRRLDGARAFLARVMPSADVEQFDLKGLVMAGTAKLGNFVASNAGAVLSSTGGLISDVVLMLFVLFFFVRDGEELLNGLRALSPLRSDQEESLLQEFRLVSRSSLLGILGTAAAQGAVGGIGLAITGLPGVFWGSVMAISSLIPFVGTALVWAPAAGFLALTGHKGLAVFLVLWSIVLIGSIDNFLRPLLMRGGSNMSTLWMFFAVIGGLQLFGLPGMVYGPIVFGLCQVLLRLYQHEFGDFLTRPAPPPGGAP
jgi:predicted PurR-regulated permease PerM